MMPFSEASVGDASIRTIASSQSTARKIAPAQRYNHRFMENFYIGARESYQYFEKHTLRDIELAVIKSLDR